MRITTTADGYRAFERFFNAHDLDGLVSLYEPTAKLVLPEGEAVGHDAIRTAFARLVSLGGAMHMEPLTSVTGDRLIVTIANWHLTAPNGQTMLQAESLEVWRKQDDDTLLAAINCPFGTP